MKAVFDILLNDLSIFFRQRGNLVGSIILPIFFALLLGWLNSDDDGPVRLRVDVLDLDGSPASTRLLDDLRRANDALLLCPLDNDAEDFCRLENQRFDQEAGIERARSGRTNGFIVIPVGYGAAVEQAAPMQIEFFSTEDPALPGPVRQTLQNVLQEVNSAVVAARVGSRFLGLLSGLLSLPENTPTADISLEQAIYTAAARRLEERAAPVRYTLTAVEAEPSGVQQGFGQSITGMGSMYVMLTVFGGMVVLLRERRQWTLPRLAALPLTKGQILGGKIGAYVVLGMLQFLLMFVLGLLVGIDYGDDPLALFMLMAAFVLCITALTFTLAAWVRSEGQANGLRNLIGLTLAPLGGAWWPLEVTPQFMQTLGHISPVAWVMDGFHDLLFYQGSLVTVLPEIGVLLGAAVLLFVVGVRGFRVLE